MSIRMSRWRAMNSIIWMPARTPSPIPSLWSKFSRHPHGISTSAIRPGCIGSLTVRRHLHRTGQERHRALASRHRRGVETDNVGRFGRRDEYRILELPDSHRSPLPGREITGCRRVAWHRRHSILNSAGYRPALSTSSGTARNTRQCRRRTGSCT